VIEQALNQLQSKYKSKIQVEVQPLKNYVMAEEYHQDFYKKNVLSKEEMKKYNVEKYLDEFF